MYARGMFDGVSHAYTIRKAYALFEYEVRNFAYGPTGAQNGKSMGQFNFYASIGAGRCPKSDPVICCVVWVYKVDFIIYIGSLKWRP